MLLNISQSYTDSSNLRIFLKKLGAGAMAQWIIGLCVQAWRPSTFFKSQALGLQRWLSGYECPLLFQETRVWFPGPHTRLFTTDCNSSSKGSAPLTSAGTCTRVHAHTHIQLKLTNVWFEKAGHSFTFSCKSNAVRSEDGKSRAHRPPAWLLIPP